MAEIQRKCAEKQLKIRTGNWFLPGLMIVLLLLGAAAVTCLHFGIQDQKRAARLLDEAKQEREILLENVKNPDRDTFLNLRQLSSKAQKISDLPKRKQKSLLIRLC